MKDLLHPQQFNKFYKILDYYESCSKVFLCQKLFS